MTPRASVLIPGGRYQRAARGLSDKLSGRVPWEPLAAPEAVPEAPTQFRQMATAVLLVAGLLVLLFFVP